MTLRESGTRCAPSMASGVVFAALAMVEAIGDNELWREYDRQAEAEARRIGQSLDRDTWNGI